MRCSSSVKIRAILNSDRSISGSCQTGVSAVYVGLELFTENEDNSHLPENPHYYISGVGSR